jgi:hypothetical protein
MIRAQVSWWPGNVSVGGTHVHHLVWGILLLLISGYCGIAFEPDSPWRELLAILFGIGAGLTLDEFALWLHLRDVYWEREGRRSIDAVIVAGTLGLLVVLGFRVFLDLAEDAALAFKLVVASVGAAGIVVGVVNGLKGKFGWAVASLFVPPVGLVGAARPAKEGSAWERVRAR